MRPTAARFAVAAVAGATLVGLVALPSSAATASLAQTYGPVGAPVTITGSGFTGATAVSFNGTLASAHVDSDTEISTTVPGDATTGPVTVTDSGGNPIDAGTFTVQRPTAATITRSAGVLRFPQTLTVRAVL